MTISAKTREKTNSKYLCKCEVAISIFVNQIHIQKSNAIHIHINSCDEERELTEKLYSFLLFYIFIAQLFICKHLLTMKFCRTCIHDWQRI